MEAIDTHYDFEHGAAATMRDVKRLWPAVAQRFRQAANYSILEDLEEQWEKGNANQSSLRIAARLMLSHPEPMVRCRAIECLEAAGVRADVTAILNYRFDSAWTVRATTYSAISGLGGKSAFKRILPGLKDRHPVVRRYADVALVEVGGEDARSHLGSARTSERQLLALPGLHLALALLGEEDSVEQLRHLALNEDVHVSSPAKEGLSEVGASLGLSS